MPDALYERDGDRFVATELTRGPWNPDHQHAGPPAALLARAIERASAHRRRPDHAAVLRHPRAGADRAARGRRRACCAAAAASSRSRRR